jgi:hypothetical protein
VSEEGQTFSQTKRGGSPAVALVMTLSRRSVFTPIWPPRLRARSYPYCSTR